MSGSYLLDTSVVSLLAPDRKQVDPHFLAWVRRQDLDLYVSTFTIAELQQGVARLQRLQSGQRVERLQAWLADLIAALGSNALPLTVEVALAAGEMSDHALAIGRHPGLADILIAATAKVHGLTLLTLNTRHFEPLGILMIDPQVELPS